MTVPSSVSATAGLTALAALAARAARAALAARAGAAVAVAVAGMIRVAIRLTTRTISTTERQTTIVARRGPTSATSTVTSAGRIAELLTPRAPDIGAGTTTIQRAATIRSTTIAKTRTVTTGSRHADKSALSSLHGRPVAGSGRQWGCTDCRCDLRTFLRYNFGFRHAIRVQGTIEALEHIAYHQSVAERRSYRCCRV